MGDFYERPWRLEGGERRPQIRVDVREDDTSPTIKAEIPGVKKEAIDARVDGNVVTLAAEVKGDGEEKKAGRALRSGRSYGHASRSFSLSSDVDDRKADATYRDGGLTLHLPKKARAASRWLSIG